MDEELKKKILEIGEVVKGLPATVQEKRARNAAVAGIRRHFWSQG